MSNLLYQFKILEKLTSDYKVNGTLAVSKYFEDISTRIERG